MIINNNNINIIRNIYIQKKGYWQFLFNYPRARGNPLLFLFHKFNFLSDKVKYIKIMVNKIIPSVE